MIGKRLRTGAVAMAAAAALGVGAFTALGPLTSSASSHREAPLVAADPQVDGTDLYAFVSPYRPNTITAVSSWLPFEEPAGGPNFYPWAENTNYDIKFDTNADAKPDVTYRWIFSNHYRNGDTFLYNTGPVSSLSDADLNFTQTYDLWRIRGSNKTRLLDDAPVAPSNVGKASMSNYKQALFDGAVIPFGGAPSYSWAGQSDDAFFLDLRVFDLLYGGDLSETGDDTLAGFNVNTIALQIPKRALEGASADQIVGIWTTASRPGIRIENGDGTRAFKGGDVQVSRLGMPLVNEVVVPVASKDYFNSSKPSGDAAFLPKVEDPELPHLLHAVYGTDVPDSDPGTPGIQRADLVSVFLTGVDGLNMPDGVTPSEMLRLNMAIDPCTSGCSRLGVLGGDLAGFPNGRRLSDDIIDISLRVVLGALLDPHQALADSIGDGVNHNDVPFNGEFPYVGYPHAGSQVSPH